MSENQTNDQIQEEVQEQDINILKKVRIEKLDELKKDTRMRSQSMKLQPRTL